MYEKKTRNRQGKIAETASLKSMVSRHITGEKNIIYMHINRENNNSRKQVAHRESDLSLDTD